MGVDRERVIRGWERCKVCDMSLLASEEGKQAYLDCEYSTGMYCRRDRLIDDTIALLKEQEAEGKWIYGEDETGVDGWHCSSCGFFEPWFYEFTDDIDFIRFYGFCPSCGRKMTSYTGKPTQEGR